MNTATRVIQSGGFRAHNEGAYQTVRINFGVVLLVLLLFATAFGVVYMKDFSRRLFIQSQNLQQVSQTMQVRWGKLLLEQSTWSRQARIQSIAQNKLNMVMPAGKHLVLIDE